MARDHEYDTTLARVSSLETSVGALTADIRSIAESVDKLRFSLSEGQRPQWANLISACGIGIVVVAAIGSAFISPLNMMLTAHSEILKERGAIIESIQDRIRKSESEIIANQKEQTIYFATNDRDLHEINHQGAPITRERLSVIEHELKGLSTIATDLRVRPTVGDRLQKLESSERPK